MVMHCMVRCPDIGKMGIEDGFICSGSQEFGHM